MKMILIALNEALESSLIESLEACCPNLAYTQWREVLGRGHRSEPHLRSHVWPKANHVFMTCVEDATAKRIMDTIRSLRERHGAEGIKAFLLPVEDVT